MDYLANSESTTKFTVLCEKGNTIIGAIADSDLVIDYLFRSI
ncbi:hypothetical protein HMPREF0514_10587 [Lactobacillus paragasseri JV-V03]|uniref:Uncharacterized protein n=1 Tax=Lactobacillus paragasseri JV-V03 TaxID=525326 RepID=A0AA87DMC1_9LACO|nr:hypothetical protein HMPREF0514_10587 [Lactobacillus paragasseri JV-V03]